MDERTANSSSYWLFISLQRSESGQRTSAGRQKKAWGRAGKSWVGVADMRVTQENQ